MLMLTEQTVLQISISLCSFLLLRNSQTLFGRTCRRFLFINNNGCKSEYTQNSFAESTNYDDFNWSYGWGAGILFQVAKDLGDVKKLYVDLKARYLYGTEAEYLTENDVVIENGRAYYYPRLSKTDLLSFHIGVVLIFINDFLKLFGSNKTIIQTE
jgi:hypothetical protein